MTGFGSVPLPDENWFRGNVVAPDSAIRDRVLRDAPELSGALESGDRLAAVRALVRWTVSVVRRRSPEDVNPDYWYRLRPEDRTVGAMLALFDHDALNAHGRGASGFLAGVCELFGFPAYAYCGGVSLPVDGESAAETFLHRVVFVATSNAGKEVWLAYDPLFASEYRLVGEECTDVRDLLNRLGRDPQTPIDRSSLAEPPAPVVIESPGEGHAAVTFDEWVARVRTRPSKHRLQFADLLAGKRRVVDFVRDKLDFEGPVRPWHLLLFPVQYQRELETVADLSFRLEEIERPAASVSAERE